MGGWRNQACLGWDRKDIFIFGGQRAFLVRTKVLHSDPLHHQQVVWLQVKAALQSPTDQLSMQG